LPVSGVLRLDPYLVCASGDGADLVIVNLVDLAELAAVGPVTASSSSLAVSFRIPK
jgi:hypothetical protein